MRHQGRASTTADAPAGAAPSRRDDGWGAFSYVLGGGLLYGGLGWLLDAWLGTRAFVAVGLLGGVALGVYVVYAQGFRTGEQGQQGGHRSTGTARGGPA